MPLPLWEGKGGSLFSNLFTTLIASSRFSMFST